VCLSSQCNTRQRDGCTMRQSAHTFVNSCLLCPQAHSAANESADERAGGRLQRLDQLAVSVSPHPVRAVWRGKSACVCTHICVYRCTFICEFVCVCICVGVRAYGCVCLHTVLLTSLGQVSTCPLCVLCCGEMMVYMCVCVHVCVDACV